MPEQPSGIITFLFTDIEGSTQLWEKYPEQMKLALAEHDQILRLEIEKHAGYVFKTIGDAFCATFASPIASLDAALAIQHQLQTPLAGLVIHVRIGLHTGIAEERNKDYFGPTVNRVARLQAVAHGGQTLISGPTYEKIQANLPNEVQAVHLGEFRLKDLFRPEQIYQVNAPGLPTEFPPIRTLDSKLNNLPTQATPFIGRERELAAILNLLSRSDVRLVTLTGPGGTGKTRLSLQTAAKLLNEFEHGVWFVELSPLQDATLVLPTMASVLKIKEADGEPLIETLSKHLATKQLLLVLDNFEQVISAAPVLGELLKHTQHLKILTSSREILRVYGEHDYPVPPLGLPEKSHRQSVAVLSQYEAVRLFIERARAVKSDFVITQENAPIIVEICRKLDGLPLAIELAASRSRMLKPDAILARLGNRLSLLTGGARNLPARQQTLRGAIDWSFELLNPSEQNLFISLGIFSGGWSLEAAEAVSTRDVFAELESLLEKSLIHETVGAGDETRFLMLETIREYAIEKLGQSTQRDAIYQTHANFYTVFAERYTPDVLRNTPDSSLILIFAQLAQEQENLRNAIAWSLANQHTEYVFRIGISLWLYWTYTGLSQVGFDWMRNGLSHSENTPTKLKADALRVAANLNSTDEYNPLNTDYQEQALALYREIQDLHGIAACLNNLSNQYQKDNQYLDKAIQLSEESLMLYRQLNDELRGVSPLINLGQIALIQKNLNQAEAYFHQIISIARKLGSVERLGVGLLYAGHVAYKKGQFDHAATYWRENLALAHRIRAISAIILLTQALSWLACIQQDYKTATRLMAFSETINQDIRQKIELASLDDNERQRLIAFNALGAELFDAEWFIGSQLTIDEGVEIALNVFKM